MNKALFKIVSFTIVIITVLTPCIVVYAGDDEIVYEDFICFLNEDRTLTIQEYTGHSIDLVIPETIDGKKVVEINNLGNHNNHYICNIKSLKLSGSIQKIHSYAVQVCPSLLNIYVDKSNPNYTSSDGILYSKDLKTLVAYPRGRTDTTFIVPPGVTKIGAYAFAGCTSIERVFFPSTLTCIDDSAFLGCSALSSIDIPDSVNELQWQCFSDCSSLKSVKLSSNISFIPMFAFIRCDIRSIVIPDGVELIGSYAFEENKNLTSVVIPDSVKEIQIGVFKDCPKLKVSFSGTKEQWEKIKFLDSNEDLFNAEISFEHMTYGRDNNYFNNSEEYFFDKNKGESPYEISDEVFGCLLNKIDSSSPSYDVLKNKLQEKRDKNWYGACYGIAATSLLAFTNDIDINKVAGVEGSFYDISKKIWPVNNVGLRDIINYYQLSQFIDYYDKVFLPNE